MSEQCVIKLTNGISAMAYLPKEVGGGGIEWGSVIEPHLEKTGYINSIIPRIMEEEVEKLSFKFHDEIASNIWTSNVESRIDLLEMDFDHVVVVCHPSVNICINAPESSFCGSVVIQPVGTWESYDFTMEYKVK